MPSYQSPASPFQLSPEIGGARADGAEPEHIAQPVHSDIVALKPVVRVDVNLAYADARKQAIHDFERIYVEALLARSGGNVSQAARDAKIDRVYLHRLIRRHR